MLPVLCTRLFCQVLKLLGQHDLVATPLSLVGGVGTGVMDLFVEPAQGLVKGPQDFGIGVARGTASLIKNSVYGVTDSAARITGMVGSGVAFFSFDDEFIREREAERAASASSRAGQGRLAAAGAAVKTGGVRMVKGIVSGAAGLVWDPYQGAKKDGLRGLLRGCGRGIAGAVTKPVTG